MPRLEDGREYAGRQVVAKFDPVGHFTEGGRRYKIWRYLTFYTGPDSAPICGKYDRVAPRDEHGELVYMAIRAGEIVVKPGFVYRVVPMSGAMITEHLRQSRNWKPKTTYSYEKDVDSGPVDAGIVDLRSKQ